MTYRLFIDDERFPPDDGHPWVIARTSHEAYTEVVTRGIPKFISFDHDLGGHDTAMRFLHRFADMAIEDNLDLTKLDYYVHSQNPVGRDNIRFFMKNLLRFVH